MQPTPGRIVLYVHEEETLDFRRVEPGTLCGVVAAVHPGEVLDITLFPPGRAPVPLTRIPHAASDLPTASHWHWPPRI